MSRSEIDLEAAWRNPAAVFTCPEAVAAHSGLSEAEKIEILRLWEYSIIEEDVATDQGMPGGREYDLLRRIVDALDELIEGLDVGESAPTKHGALRRRNPGGNP